MVQIGGTWSSVDRAFAREVALICQKNLVRALTTPRLLRGLHKQLKRDRHIYLPLIDFGGEEDVGLIRQAIRWIGGYLEAPSGDEMADIMALGCWLSDALLSFAELVGMMIREGFPVSVHGGLLEGRMVLYTQVSDLDALVALVGSTFPPSTPCLLAPDAVRQGSLWSDVGVPLQRGQKP